MTTRIFFASNKIGSVTKEQIQFMLDRFNLGRLLSYEPTAKGVMQQTLFVSCSSGEYVLKGNPIFEGQFIEEKFFVDNLLVRTKLPVPSPYVIDESNDIFGWSYALMPRLSGIHFNDPEVLSVMTNNDKMKIVSLLVRTLIELHSWKAEHFGEFDPVNEIIRPFHGSYEMWLFSEIRFWLEDAKQYSVINSQDIDWVEGLLEEALKLFQDLKCPSFVMGDFKPENLLLLRREHEWSLNGVIDFTTSYFGDPIADLSKILLGYLDNGDEDLARQFLAEYMGFSETKEADTERLKIHILHQRILDWGCAHATNEVVWNKELSFSQWADQFVTFVENN